uniref:THD domain-containing protein n=1 Tax=Arion vulgaris TaxID=1028688 RepID=A0A0B6ZX83_9EUPU
MSQDDPNVDSKEPFLKTNNLNNSGICSNINNINNGNSIAYNGMTATGMKPSNKEVDFDVLQKTIDKMRVWLYAITAVSTTGFVILIITVSCLYASLNYDLHHHTHKPKVGEQMAAILEREELCVPCEDFRLGPSREEDIMLKRFNVKETPNGLNCCVDQPLQLLELLKLHVERRIRQEVAKGTINQWPRAPKNMTASAKPAAHLMMTSQDLDGLQQIHGRQYAIGNWIFRDDLAFTYFTTYRHGRIVIPQDGFYFVYSQISFMEVFDMQSNEGYGSRGSSDFPSLSHYLFRYNIQYHNGGEEKLAQNSITKCWGQSKSYGEYTSYLGAVFYLRTADEIFIKVSNISMVAADPKLSYFGLFMI